MGVVTIYGAPESAGLKLIQRQTDHKSEAAILGFVHTARNIHGLGGVYVRANNYSSGWLSRRIV